MFLAGTPRSRRARPVRGPLSDGGVESRRILVVDDNPTTLYARACVLARAGFEAIQALCGAEALKVFAATRPHLVLVGLRLLDIEGVKLCAGIKRDDATVLVAAIAPESASAEERARALDDGFDAVFDASIAAAELAANLRALLRTKRSGDALRDMVARRDVLLRESNHRIKNHLQTAASLLGLQARKATDRHGRAAIETARHRIAAIAHLHAHIGNEPSGDAWADVADALGELCALYEKAFMPAATVVCALEPLALAADRALALMLLANELIANAYKHAFPDGRSGIVRVALRRRRPHVAELRVSDDGVGFDPSVGAGSLGLQLVRQFASQLHASLDLATQGGTAVTVTFPCEPQANAGSARPMPRKAAAERA